MPGVYDWKRQVSIDERPRGTAAAQHVGEEGRHAAARCVIIMLGISSGPSVVPRNNNGRRRAGPAGAIQGLGDASAGVVTAVVLPLLGVIIMRGWARSGISHGH